jgi:hypothetical protein
MLALGLASDHLSSDPPARGLEGAWGGHQSNPGLPQQPCITTKEGKSEKSSAN